MKQLSDTDTRIADDLFRRIKNSLHRWGRVDKVFIDLFIESISDKIYSTKEYIDYPTMRESRDPRKDWDALIRDIISDPVYTNLMVIASISDARAKVAPCRHGKAARKKIGRLRFSS